MYCWWKTFALITKKKKQGKILARGAFYIIFSLVWFSYSIAFNLKNNNAHSAMNRYNYHYLHSDKHAEQWPYRRPALYLTNSKLWLTLFANMSTHQSRDSPSKPVLWQQSGPAAHFYRCFLIMFRYSSKEPLFPNDLDLKGTGKTKRADGTKAAANPKLIIGNGRH